MFMQHAYSLVLLYRLHTHGYYSRLIIYSKKVTCRITNTMYTVIFFMFDGEKTRLRCHYIVCKILGACPQSTLETLLKY